jgi:hypothetical protein
MHRVASLLFGMVLGGSAGCSSGSTHAGGSSDGGPPGTAEGGLVEAADAAAYPDGPIALEGGSDPDDASVPLEASGADAAPPPADSGKADTGHAAHEAGPTGWPLTWKEEYVGTMASLYAVSGSSVTDVRVVGQEGTSASSDGSGTWGVASPTVIQTAGDLHAIWSGSASATFVVGVPGAIYRVTTPPPWSSEAFGGQDLLGVWGSGPSDVYAVGVLGTIMHRVASGDWYAQQSGVSTTLLGAWGSGAGDVYVVGEGGTILHGDSSGAWTPDTSAGVSVTLEGIWGSGPTDVYAVGAGGLILHGNRGSWNVEASGTSAALTAVWGSSATDVYVVGSAGTILHSSGNGTWSQGPVLNALYDYSSVWGSGPGDVYITEFNGNESEVVHGR